MPAAPIIGLIFFLANRLMSLPNSTPPNVSNMNAIRPSPRIISVSGTRKLSACMRTATVSPSSRLMRFASTFCAVSDRLRSTPHSRSRLPNIRKPTSATLCGDTMPAITVTTIGNRIRVVFVIFPGVYSMRIMRSFFVVIRRMQKGCTIGTSAM